MSKGIPRVNVPSQTTIVMIAYFQKCLAILSKYTIGALELLQSRVPATLNVFVYIGAKGILFTICPNKHWLVATYTVQCGFVLPSLPQV